MTASLHDHSPSLEYPGDIFAPEIEFDPRDDLYAADLAQRAGSILHHTETSPKEQWSRAIHVLKAAGYDLFILERELHD